MYLNHIIGKIHFAPEYQLILFQKKRQW